MIPISTPLCAAPLPEPFTIGPTWQRNDNGTWLLPEQTLGLAIIMWIHNNLLLDGEPVRLTGEQMRFIMWMYAIVPNGQPGSGRFLYREIVLQRMKGWG